MSVVIRVRSNLGTPPPTPSISVSRGPSATSGPRYVSSENITWKRGV
jgi:hypothetical protein